jgi:hypothetical protein
MEETVLPEHLLNKQTYSDTNSAKMPFAMLMPRGFGGLDKVSWQLAAHESMTIFLKGEMIICPANCNDNSHASIFI